MKNATLPEPSLKDKLSPMSLDKTVKTKQTKYFRRKPIKRPSNLLSLQTCLLNAMNLNIPFKPKKQYKNEDFEHYSDKINRTMQAYRAITPRAPEQFPKEDNKQSLSSMQNDKYISPEDETEIKRLYDNNRSFLSKGLSSLNEESMLKINIQEMEFRNPYQSVGVLKHNQLIYDDICKNYLMRQKLLFDDSIKEFKQYTTKLKAKMPKVKVVGSTPKINLDIPVVDLVDAKKKKDLPLPPIKKDELKLFSYYRYPNKNFPEGREQFSLCIGNGEIVIIGGVSSLMKSMPIWSLNIEKLEWKKIIPKNFAHCRFGHTCCAYQNKLYIFGGRTKYLNSSVVANLEIYNFHDSSWSVPSLNSKSGPQLRRNHVAVIVGQQMLIHGGITETNEVLSDCFLLNLNPLKWVTCSVNPYSPAPKVYGHAAVMGLPSEITLSHRFNIYKIPEIGLSKIKGNNTKEKGLFVFGGKSKEEGGVSNELWVLEMGKKPLEWYRPETKGEPPCPRYYHTMDYFEKGNFLIIHGGRNDERKDFCTLSDTFLFDLENYEWLKVTLYSHLQDFEVMGRCGHKSIIFGNKLIILGGMNDEKYIGSSLFVVNLDFYYFPNKQNSFENLILNSGKNESAKEKYQQVHTKNQLGIVRHVSLPFITKFKRNKDEEKGKN